MTTSPAPLGPYELNTIIQGDCLEVMPGIPDKSVDLLLSDWPYGTTACDWDSVIPLEPLWRECKRVIKPSGAIVLTASQPFTSVLVMSNLSWFRYDWTWEKDNGSDFLNVNRKPFEAHESVLVFYEKLPTYNPQMLRGEPYRLLRGTAHRAGLQQPDVANGTITVNSGTRYPRSVIKFATEKGLHPTQKPVALFSYLIRTYSNPGDLVLDNAAGSCTTAIAAIETGRNWLCIEKLSKYVKIGQERVRERMSQPFLPGLVETSPAPVQLDLESAL